jgi:S-adenosylmethionine:tRNA ribosyltransferase-isomerase
MKLADFQYNLPEELIAHYPEPERSSSRLLHLNRASGAFGHHHFYELTNFLHADDLLIFNNTRVIAARLLGHKASGGRIEVLIERVLNEHEALAQIRSSKSPKPGMKLYFEGDDRSVQLCAEVLDRQGEFFHLRFHGQQPLLKCLEHFGHIPLPPYIKRPDEASDRERYQTVYSSQPGAVAAPTAGLHFDQALLDALAAKGVDQGFVTLHVGSGTFQPVRVENVLEHPMHSEVIDVPQPVCAQVQSCKQRGGRVIAVGTTSVRSLESAARETASTALNLQPYQGETSIFIYPGFEFQVVDAMITNFHLSESTLMMLVSAFAGRANIMAAYQCAIEARYRFFSYGDAMLIL